MHLQKQWKYLFALPRYSGAKFKYKAVVVLAVGYKLTDTVIVLALRNSFLGYIHIQSYCRINSMEQMKQWHNVHLQKQLIEYLKIMPYYIPLQNQLIVFAAMMMPYYIIHLQKQPSYQPYPNQMAAGHFSAFLKKTQKSVSANSFENGL